MFKSLVSIHNSQKMLIKTDTVASFTNNLFKKKTLVKITFHWFFIDCNCSIFCYRTKKK